MEKKEIRILYVFGAVSNGGVEHIAGELAKHMDSKVIKISAVYHNCVQQGGIKNIPIIYELWPQIEKAPNFFFFNAKSYRRWWKNYISMHDKFDYVHLHYTDSAFCFVDLFNKMGTKTIAHAHNPWAKPYNPGVLVSMMQSYTIRYKATYLFACSKQTATEIFGRNKANSKKCYILHNGISTDRFRFNNETRQKLRHKLNINVDTIIIGNAGRLEKQKNQVFLVKTFKLFHEKHPNSILWIIGTGTLQNKIEKLVRKYKIEDAVFFLGARNDIQDLYQCMDVFVFPSLYEGLGIVLIEAQTSGLPCIISKNIPEEADININLVTRLSLMESKYEWINAIEKSYHMERKDCSYFTDKAGFNIKNVAVWLQKFYCDNI